MTPSVRLAVILVGAWGCGARGEPSPETLPAADAGQPRAADTLVLSAPGGVTIWLSEGRQAIDSSGAPCRERAIEIRRDTTRRTVPLLFTVSPVVLLDDTTIRAELADHCRPRARYRVNLRTGLPVRIQDSM